MYINYAESKTGGYQGTWSIDFLLSVENCHTENELAVNMPDWVKTTRV